MIIIKTRKGDVLVNDKEVTSVRHDRENHTATVIRNGGPMFNMHDPITEVEAVFYTNEAQPTQWKDEGSEIQHLRREMESLKIEWHCQKEITKRTKKLLRSLGHECVQWAQYYHKDIPLELNEQMRKSGEEAKAYVNDNEDWVYRREYIQQHTKPEEIEADEVARLNLQVEALDTENRRLKANADVFKSQIDSQAHTIRSLTHRTFWQRLFNKE